MTRLAGHRHRTKLARRLRRAAQDAEGWHSLLFASRPPVGILELLPHTALAREIPEHLDTPHANVRGIALTDVLTLLPNIEAYASAGEISRLLVEAGVTVYRLEPARTSLEERFLDITSRLGEPA